MTDQGVEDRGQVFWCVGDLEHIVTIGVEPVFSLGGDDHRCGFMGVEYGRVLDDIPEYALPCSCGADYDQRFA